MPVSDSMPWDDTLGLLEISFLLNEDSKEVNFQKQIFLTASLVKLSLENDVWFKAKKSCFRNTAS